MRALLAMAMLAACGDNVADPTQPHSGTQLKLAWYEYEGGARELETGWYHDAVLGARCTPRTWSDGRRYCTPAIDEAVFINDTCTRALGRTLIGITPLPSAPFFATTFELADEPLPVPSRLFRRGQATLAPPAIWQKGIEGCIPKELDENFEYFELGAEIPTSDLVHVHRSEPYGRGALAVIDDLGNDGLRVPVALYDRAAEVECTTSDMPNLLEVPCTPVTAPTVTVYFLDPACTDTVVAVPIGTKPTLASLHDEQTSCTTHYRLGRELVLPPQQLLFEASGTACALTARPSERTFFELAERGYVPTLGRVRDAGTQRIRSIARVNGTLQLRDPLMYDAELDTECWHDGEMSCVPRAVARAVPATVPIHFADPQCQDPLGLAFVPRGACDPAQRFASDGGDYYELGEPYTGPIYVPSTGDTCSGYAPPAPVVAYRIGAPVARSAFARAKLVIDP